MLICKTDGNSPQFSTKSMSAVYCVAPENVIIDVYVSLQSIWRSTCWNHLVDANLINDTKKYFTGK